MTQQRHLTEWSYDDLGGGRYRVRLVDENGKTRRKGVTRALRQVEFEMPEGFRSVELRRRVEAEARKLLEGG